LYEIEIGIIRKKDKILLISIEMKVFKRTDRCPFDHKRNEEILEDLKVEPVD
jgi:hypothetical protein